jgi:hypothetical protein
LHIDQTVYGESGPDSKNNIARWRQLISVETKRLTYQPFDPVAANGITSFSMHTDSQPIIILIVRQKNHDKIVPSEPLTKPINALKLPGCFD